jgi:2-phospho-L-lactate guanylyltransferase
MEATVRTFSPGTRSGTVLLDDGTEFAFDAAAFDAGGFRLLRPGQRVRISIEETRVTRVAMPGAAMPGPGLSSGQRSSAPGPGESPPRAGRRCRP